MGHGQYNGAFNTSETLSLTPPIADKQPPNLQMSLAMRLLRHA
jgi:hypothetical protein